MSIEITWLGHNCWLLVNDQQRILIDPFLDDSPVAPVKARDVEADFILISHGHFDHIADAPAIANRTGATVYANYEIATWLQSQHGVQNAIGMNLGGVAKTPFGTAKLTVAWHSSQLPDGAYGGSAGGWLLTIGGKKLYFACDTALFSDMQLIGAVGLDFAVVPIGDLFTMGSDDSLQAIEWLKPQKVAPAHYNTWPPIAQDATQWAERVRAKTKAEPMVVTPGGKFLI
ncbi:MAG TPA: metal-dependent hydrolase [Pirellulaceae bacterium]|nr:metal-dependent hydrolase [Pirellulaceae bacterium]